MKMNERTRNKEHTRKATGVYGMYPLNSLKKLNEVNRNKRILVAGLYHTNEAMKQRDMHLATTYRYGIVASVIRRVSAGEWPDTYLG